MIKLESPGPVFFRQERMGRGFRPFSIFKFRTMFHRRGVVGRPITAAGDPRITRIGRLLRRSKIDELPQLLNVFKGEMSVVGPRPELRRSVELFREDYRRILAVRPGVTDPASIRYRHEEERLGRSVDPEAEYVRSILPEKIELAKSYVQTASLAGDLGIIARTLIAVCHASSREPQTSQAGNTG